MCLNSDYEYCSSSLGLQILYQLLQNIGNEEAASQSFYQAYYTDILQHLFSVVTDTSHTAGEKAHTLSLILNLCAISIFSSVF